MILQQGDFSGDEFSNDNTSLVMVLLRGFITTTTMKANVLFTALKVEPLDDDLVDKVVIAVIEADDVVGMKGLDKERESRRLK